MARDRAATSLTVTVMVYRSSSRRRHLGWLAPCAALDQLVPEPRQRITERIGLLCVLPRKLELVQFAVQQPHVVVNFGRIRVELEGLLVARQSFVSVLLRLCGPMCRFLICPLCKIDPVYQTHVAVVWP